MHVGSPEDDLASVSARAREVNAVSRHVFDAMRTAKWRMRRPRKR